MKEDDKFDQLLRQRMEDYKPATLETSRQRFLSSLPAGKSNGIHRGWIYGLSTLIVLLALVFFSVSISDSHLEAPIENDSKSVLKANNKVLNSEDPIIEIAKDELETNTITAETNDKRTDYKNSDLSIEPTYQNYDLNIELAHKNYNLINEPDFNDSLETKVSVPKVQDGNADVTKITENEKFAWEDSLTDTIVSLMTNEISNAENEDDDGVQPPDFNLRRHYIGLFYKPGLMWNIIENEKLTHSVGIEWQSRFFNGNYIMGIGVGMQRTTGYYEYAVDFNKFLGNYQRLDSISFLWNAREFTMQQTQYTSEQVVHDTAIQTDYHKLYRDFVYLQVPFVMGYDVIRKEKYSIGIRFSPILSILMSKKPVEFQYEAGLDKVVQINRITPDRVRTNWQLNTGINFSRRISENLQFEIEPGFTYYFNSVYEKPKVSSRPYGASLRIAIGITY